jgi:mannose-1-phosphate guanylyltransferase
MNALLLAAGLGSRLRPITERIPKCLVPILGRPLLSYWLELILDSEVAERLVINTHYLSKKVEEFCEAHAHADRILLSDEPKLLGTGGTLIKHAPAMLDDCLLVGHADNLTLFAPSDFLARHASRPKHCMLTMMTFETDSPQSCGIIELDREGVVQAFHEKVPNPPSRLANAAVFIFSPEALKSICALFPMAAENSGSIDISLHIIPKLLGRIYTFHNDIYHRDIGDARSLDLAESEFASCYSRFKSLSQK